MMTNKIVRRYLVAVLIALTCIFATGCGRDDAEYAPEDARQRQREAVETLEMPLEMECEHSDIKFRLIPAGEFMMGSPEDEEGRVDDDEGPQRKVTLTKPYYMGIYPVTQAQWRAVMGTTVRQQRDKEVHPEFSPIAGEGDNHPMYYVSWNEAEEFCRKLSEETGRSFRLPTEAEWEYAVRADTTTAYYFGDDGDRLGDYAWYVDNSDDKTHPVGQKKANAWGLYDMYGNVWEWCAVQVNYGGLPDTDPKGPPDTGTSRAVSRGGAWPYTSRFCRSATRAVIAPVSRTNRLGFRIVLDFQ